MKKAGGFIKVEEDKQSEQENNDQSVNAEEAYYLQMLDRMNTIFVDYTYMKDDKVKQMEKKEFEVNY